MVFQAESSGSSLQRSFFLFQKPINHQNNAVCYLIGREIATRHVKSNIFQKLSTSCVHTYHLKGYLASLQLKIVVPNASATNAKH